MVYLIAGLLMLDTFKGGRGKKAPYATEMRRIPSPIKELVERLSSEYKSLVQEYYYPEDERLLQRVSEILAGNFLDQIQELTAVRDELHSKNSKLEEENARLRSLMAELSITIKELIKKAETERQSTSQPGSSMITDPKAIMLLREALKLRANAGGAIKRKIEHALARLTPG